MPIELLAGDPQGAGRARLHVPARAAGALRAGRRQAAGQHLLPGLLHPDRSALRAARWVTPRFIVDAHIPSSPWCCSCGSGWRSRSGRCRRCVPRESTIAPRCWSASGERTTARLAALPLGADPAFLRAQRPRPAGVPRGGAESPGRAEAWSVRAFLYAQKGELSRAIPAFEQALALSPTIRRCASTRLSHAAACGQAPRGDGGAFGAIELDPKLDRAWYGLGLSLAHVGRYDEAVAKFREAARLQPFPTLATIWRPPSTSSAGVTKWRRSTSGSRNSIPRSPT